MSEGRSAPQRKNAPCSARSATPERATSSAIVGDGTRRAARAVRAATAAAQERERLALSRHQQHVGLRVAPVHADQRPREVLPVRVDHPIGQPVGDVCLADERVREQRAEDPVAAAAQSRVERELLVGGHVRDEPALDRRQARHLERLDTVRADPSRHLDDRVVVEERQRARVSQVDHVPTLAAAAEEARDELDGGLRVASTAPPREQGRLLRQALVCVLLEQVALDLRHLLGPREGASLVLHDAVVLVEVVQVVGRDVAEASDEVGRQARRGRHALDVLAEQARQDVFAVETHAELPGEVIEADVVELDSRVLDLKQVGEVLLEHDRSAAEPDRTMALVEQRLRDDPDRVREVDDPGVRRELAHAASAMSSTTGTVRSALASPPNPVVSWPRQPHASGTDSSTIRAAWPPTRIWISTASAPSTASSRRVVSVSAQRMAGAVEHPRRQAADDRSRSSARSWSARSSTGSSSRRRTRPSITSGVYVEPPPMTASFTG